MTHSLRRISLAPMMDCTDRHFRYFARLLSKRVYLYTEMITTKAILHGDLPYILGKSDLENPVAAQLGGSDPRELGRCMVPLEDYGYAEVNLNVGCPSDRVSSGNFGACLMKEPALVAECVQAMKSRTHLPVTVKTRIGVDDQDSYEHLHYFTGQVVAAGADALIIHARKAWLQGLSPKENREVPPLRYDVVRQLQQDFPQVEIILNGGIQTWESAEEHLQTFSGVMLGREPYRNPYMLAEADRRFFGSPEPGPSRREVFLQYMDYVSAGLSQGLRLHWMARHITGLYLGQKGAKLFRTLLSEGARREGAGLREMEQALTAVESLPPIISRAS